MELMNRIRERVVAWQKKRVRTVVFPLAGKLCAVETVEGKRLGQWQADYDGRRKATGTVAGGLRW